RKTSAARTRAGCRTAHILDPIPNERHAEVGQISDQYFAHLARSHRGTVPVELEVQILRRNMQAGMPLALAGHVAALAGAIAIEHRTLEYIAKKLSLTVEQGLAHSHDRVRPDGRRATLLQIFGQYRKRIGERLDEEWAEDAKIPGMLAQGR